LERIIEEKKNERDEIKVGVKRSWRVVGGVSGEKKKWKKIKDTIVATCYTWVWREDRKKDDCLSPLMFLLKCQTSLHNPIPNHII
jgi:hypothetical protein